MLTFRIPEMSEIQFLCIDILQKSNKYSICVYHTAFSDTFPTAPLECRLQLKKSPISPQLTQQNTQPIEQLFPAHFPLTQQQSPTQREFASSCWHREHSFSLSAKRQRSTMASKMSSPTKRCGQSVFQLPFPPHYTQ